MKLISILEVAETLGKSRRGVEYLITRGEFIQPIQIGGELRFEISEVEAWVAKQPRGRFPVGAGLKRHQDARKESKP
jgi:excisionase family DNA binding protein